MKKTFLKIHPNDDVLVALQDLPKGQKIDAEGIEIELQHDIAAKHKFTTKAFGEDEAVTMYGVLVGKTTQPIPKGGLISTKNLHHASQDFGRKQKEYVWDTPDASAWLNRTFMGFHRADGQVGTRNYWLVIPLVFCENRNILTLKEAFLKALGYNTEVNIYQKQLQSLTEYHQNHGNTEGFAFDRTAHEAAKNPFFKNVDGIKFLTHESGCGESKEDSMNLAGLMAGYAVNPNVAGVTVLSLGCQHTQIDILKEKIAERDPNFSKPILFFERQKWQSEYEMLSAATRQTFEGLVEINKCTRQAAPLSQLSIGVKCGGSDGFSGISANPAVGHAADLVAALGGRVLMAEYPELCGVEQELINRAETAELGDDFAYLMREYAARAAAVGSGFDMNPSPGNIKDGLITDAIKSAGAAKKGGTSPVIDVVGYGKYAFKNGGLSLVCTPGNDVLATTGMAGAGATIQLFTTGLGTATGNPISPMVKLSTNNALAKKMPDIIDINCGDIIEGEKTVEQVGEEILEYIIGLASGDYDTKAQQLGQDDFMFWKRGVSL